MRQDFVSIIVTALCYLGYVCAAERFCKRHLQDSRFCERMNVFCFLLYGALREGVIRYCPVPAVLLTLLHHILLIGLVLSLYRDSAEKKVFVASALITVTTLVENFCVSLFSCAALFWRHRVQGIAIPVLGEKDGRIIACAGLAITIVSISCVSKYFSAVLYGKSKRQYLLLTFPLLAATLMIDVANWGAGNGILVRSGGSMSLYYDQLFSHTEFCVLTALSMCGTGFYIFGMNRIYLEQEKNNRYHLQIAAYEMLEEQYRQSERLRHDLKNHVTALSGLLENKEWEKMRDYLRNMEDRADLGSGEEITGSRVVDILLYQKRKIAERKDILWECDVQIPRECCINEFDLCVLFGNILDNAIEACERSKRGEPHRESGPFIRIQAGAVKRCFLLEARNSAGTAGRQKESSAEREDAKHRGIGLLNVGDVVQRYDGTMNTEILDGVFAISILIPLNAPAHDIEQAV